MVATGRSSAPPLRFRGLSSGHPGYRSCGGRGLRFRREGALVEMGREGILGLGFAEILAVEDPGLFLIILKADGLRTVPFHRDNLGGIIHLRFGCCLQVRLRCFLCFRRLLQRDFYRIVTDGAALLEALRHAADDDIRNEKEQQCHRCQHNIRNNNHEISSFTLSLTQNSVTWYHIFPVTSMTPPAEGGKACFVRGPRYNSNVKVCTILAGAFFVAECMAECVRSYAGIDLARPCELSGVRIRSMRTGEGF